jgi:hypothetical protein
LKIVITALAIPTLSLALIGCSPASYRTFQKQAASVGTLSAPTVLCDATNPNNIVSATSGLKGSLYFLKDTDARVNSSQDLIRTGTRINADLFMNNVDVPTVVFTNGFATNKGQPVANEKGDALVEWFAFDLKSKIRLATGDATGEYQLALISDDGSTLSVNDAGGVLKPLIANENQHSTAMACATTTIDLKADSRLPMNLSYFQGPRDHIALIVMWRKVSDSKPATLQDPECGKSGADYFFNIGTANSPAVARKPYMDLISRGWKPLSTENFELQSGSNLCNVPI